jgi:hypothetical protein
MLKKWLVKTTLIGIVASLLVLVLASCSSSSNANQITPVPSKTQTATTLNPATSPSSSEPPVSASIPSPSASLPLIPTGKPANPVKQVTIDVQVNGESIIVPMDKVISNLNTRFKLATVEGEMTFMAYVWDGKLNVRADICPPCRSKSFTLTKGTLVCDACGTVFDAMNGKGINGACVAYPKESAQYQIVGDSIVLSKTSLVTAYESTLKAG